eukprot:Sro60_g034540.2  (325) ;mRNA; f:23757-24731
MIPVLEERGFRVLALDWLGMGKSDKPVDLSQHTFLKQVERLKAFIKQVVPEAMDEPTINLFIQDWGSLIGFRVVGDEPQWFRRVVSANGNLPVIPKNPFTIVNPVNYNCSDTRSMLDVGMDRFQSNPCGADQSCFGIWANYALTSPALLPSDVIQIATTMTLDDGALAQYDAPFPDFVYKAAIRTFPSMIAGLHEPESGNTAAWASLGEFSRPYLALAGEDDPGLGSEETQDRLTSHIPGASVHEFEHKRYPDAGHFIQEDVGEEMAAYVADFIQGTPFMDEGPAELEGVDDASSVAVHGAELNGGMLVFLMAALFLRKFMSVF